MVNTKTLSSIYHSLFTIYHSLMSIPFIKENDQTRARREHLQELQRLVGNVYPNKFKRSRVTGDEDTITALVEKFKSYEPQVTEGERPAQDVLERANEELKNVSVRISGRIASPTRVMGKAAFVHLSDGVKRLQIYVRKADVKGIHNDDTAPLEEGWELFNLLDHGDFIGVSGYLFITKTGELSVHVQELQFLSKAMLPMPDKMHGISDPEIRQRQRYADLIAGSLKVETGEEANAASRELSSREVFERRSKIIREMRRFLDDHGYIEVETPMLSPKATGAVARPFVTHHNALDIDLYARIAPELYLKRLVVGGFEKVYELNRNFRNEGIDRTHNPEFTMLEFYQAYSEYEDLLRMTEELIADLAERVGGSARLPYGELEIDFTRPWQRLTMREAVIHHWPDETDRPTVADLSRREALLAWINKLPGHLRAEMSDVQRLGDGYLLGELFEAVAETHLVNPTFITEFPTELSPLSKQSARDPRFVDRFALFIAGMEIANAFCEINDPRDQRQRFEEQMTRRATGDEEAMVIDEDYVRALSYGMALTARDGIGNDRLVMLLTNSRSIRDVILFPYMRPESGGRGPGAGGQQEMRT